MLTLGHETQRSFYVLAFEIREIGKYLVFRHPGGEIVEHVRDGEPQAANARLFDLE